MEMSLVATRYATGRRADPAPQLQSFARYERRLLSRRWFGESLAAAAILAALAIVVLGAWIGIGL